MMSECGSDSAVPIHKRSRWTGLGSLRPWRKDAASAVPGFSAGWRISGLIAFGSTGAYCGGSQALLWAAGVCLSVLDAKKPLHTRPMVAKRSFSSFTPASAPHPTSSHDALAKKSVEKVAGPNASAPRGVLKRVLDLG